MRTIFESNYADFNDVLEVAPRVGWDADGQVCILTKSVILYANSCLQDDNSDNNTTNILNKLGQFVPSHSAVDAQDKLATFLNTPPELPAGGNALLWWQRNRSAFLRLALMAMDFLSIPGECLCCAYSNVLIFPHSNLRRY